MKLTTHNLRSCLTLAETIGSVKEAHMYDAHFISVEGVTTDGDQFTVTLNLKEEKEDAEELE